QERLARRQPALLRPSQPSLTAPGSWSASLEPLEIARRIVTQKITRGRIAGRLSRSDANDFRCQTQAAGDMTPLHMVEAQTALRYFAGMQVELRHKPQLWPNAWNTWTTRLSPIGHFIATPRGPPGQRRVEFGLYRRCQPTHARALRSRSRPLLL